MRTMRHKLGLLQLERDSDEQLVQDLLQVRSCVGLDGSCFGSSTPLSLTCISDWLQRQATPALAIRGVRALLVTSSAYLIKLISSADHA